MPLWIERLSLLCSRHLSAANFIDQALKVYGERPFLCFDQPVQLERSYTHMSHRQLLGSVSRFSHVLRAQGIARFARVAICKDNAPDYFVYGCGAMRSGAIAVPINGGMAIDTLIDYLAYVGASVLVTDRARWVALQEAQVQRRCPALTTALLTDGELPALLAQANDQFEPVPLQSSDDILIVHTSGTTGTPKGVLHTNASFIAGLKGMLKLGFLLPRKDRFLSVFPFNHYIAYQGIASSLIGGNNGMLMSVPTAPDLLDAIESFAPAFVFSFPHCFVQMYDHGMKGRNLSSVKMWMAGADSSHEAHIREFVRHGSFIKLFGKTWLPSLYVDTLGSSEVGFPAFGRVSSCHSKLYKRCIGKRLGPGPQVKVANEHGRPLAPMQIGRFMVKGATLFKGYWNAHDKLHGVSQEGWWWTGDMGYQDAQGRYFHLDREVDWIARRSGHVSSLLLEEHMLNHPSVCEAVVVAKNTSDGDALPYIYVQAKRNQPTKTHELIAWAQTALTPQCPVELELVGADQIPRGLTGKVLKRELRRQINGG